MVFAVSPQRGSAVAVLLSWALGPGSGFSTGLASLGGWELPLPCVGAIVDRGE